MGTELEVHFGVEEEEAAGKLQMRAVVRHCGKGKIGVHFVDVDPTHETTGGGLCVAIFRPRAIAAA